VGKSGSVCKTFCLTVPTRKHHLPQSQPRARRKSFVLQFSRLNVENLHKTSALTCVRLRSAQDPPWRAGSGSLPWIYVTGTLADSSIRTCNEVFDGSFVYKTTRPEGRREGLTLRGPPSWGRCFISRPETRRSAFEAPGLIIQPNLRLSPDAIFRFFSQTCGSVDGNSWSRSLIPGSNAKRGGSSGGGRRS
jgi:hypothetical protein